MTRINSAVNVRFLTDEQLRAEHREIKRLPNSYLRSLNSRNGLQNIPEQFKLGTGHVLFFIDKGMFTLRRYLDLYNECILRGFNVTFYADSWGVYSELKDYVPTFKELHLLSDRISERILESPQQFHYFGKNISKEEAINLIKASNLYE